MIHRASLQNPLRWYLAALLLGLVVSLAAAEPAAKFQVHRLVQLICALALLLWSGRGVGSSSSSPAPLSPWYGLGLLGLAAVTLLAGAWGPIPWINLGFVGLVLLQFGLLPLLQPLWQRFRHDSERQLALFSVAVLGMDAGIWLLDRAFQIPAYSWFYRVTAHGELSSAPYLFMNQRWANQLVLLLIWAFVPLLQQLHDGLIQRWRLFWWGVCAAIPCLAMALLIATAGRGALLAIGLGTTALLLSTRWRPTAQRRTMRWAAALVLVATLLALALNLGFDHGSFFSDVAARNAQELVPASADVDKRTVLWAAFLGQIGTHGLVGQGIPAFATGAPACTPHNLWLGLLFWTGLAGTLFALLLTSGFVPWRWRDQEGSVMALPLLVGLFVYQLVDDIWLRPVSLALLLVILPVLRVSSAKGPMPVWLRPFHWPLSAYRLIALLGAALLLCSVLLPGGVGHGPSPLLRSARGVCLLLF